MTLIVLTHNVLASDTRLTWAKSGKICSNNCRKVFNRPTFLTAGAGLYPTIVNMRYLTKYAKNAKDFLDLFAKTYSTLQKCPYGSGFVIDKITQEIYIVQTHPFLISKLPPLHPKSYRTMGSGSTVLPNFIPLEYGISPIFRYAAEKDPSTSENFILYSRLLN